MRTPADASTLIYLAKADAFGLVSRSLGVLSVPPAVWRESVEAGERRGAIEVRNIRRACDEGIVRRVELTPPTGARARAITRRHFLGAGESEVLALGGRDGRVVVDEGRASRVALSMGLNPVSTLLLPALGLANGGLDRSQAVEWLHRLAIVTGARADVVLRLEGLLRRHSR